MRPWSTDGGTRAARRSIMSSIAPETHRWRWIGELADAAIKVLSSVAHRVGYPTLVGVPVSAAMLTRVAAVSPEQPLEDAAQLLVAGRSQHVPVVEHGRPIAVITRGDVAAGLEQCGPHAPVAAARYHHVVTVAPSDSLCLVLDQLRADPDSVAVVVDGGTPVGLLTVEHLAAYLEGHAAKKLA